ncbi:hypothetical protein, partial [Streptomyces levis]|uniref:hypothetical protein n=1 Tax=Streptomyces levis TaxID=285566 RepID=UPI0031DA5723
MKDAVTYHCAFEDNEGWFIDPKEFDDNAAAWVEATGRNAAEAKRLKGKKPDAVWIVVKAFTTYSVVANPVKPKK